MSDNGKVFDGSYMPFIVRWGRLTNVLGFLAGLGPAIMLYVIFGFRPPFSAIMAGFIAQASVSGVFWFVEPISYFPIFGVPATYQAFLSGNIANMRLPVAAAAQEAAGVEPGSNEGTILSCIGVAISVFVNIAILTAAVALGAAVLKQLPPSVMRSLGFILPALFGAVFAQFAVPNPKIAGVAIVFASAMTFALRKGLLAFLPGNPVYAVIIVSVFGTIFVAKKMHEMEEKKKGAAA
ncbi:MAG TPA: hypothetical protein PLB91_07285 [Spirochaetales bacterium]|nr:hypothetical protein [Spirochaetales bacterium]HRY55113.1 hypothetical protein [Spirochaetia bacterium]HRZ63874.1 hypothetical protein [Spirochaetia bacterium]